MQTECKKYRSQSILSIFNRLNAIFKIDLNLIYNFVILNSNALKLKDMDQSMTSTTFELSGYTITRNLGVVRGIIVRSRSIFGTIGAGLQTIVGGNITLLTELCEKTRLDAYTEMMMHADLLGANAVVGIRYESAEVMSNVTEVICYGTAVIAESKG